MSESSPAESADARLTGAVATRDEPALETEVGDESGVAEEGPARRSRGGRQRRHREWREGGSSVHGWGWELLGWAVLALGVGVIGATAANALLPGALGALLSLLVLWLAFAMPTLFALVRSRPRGLLRFRPIDLLYAVVLGTALRITQGWLDIAAGGNGAWPSYPSLGGGLSSSWFFDDFLATVLIAPVLEEFFFRVLVLVAVYSAVRRLAGQGVAFLVATIVSTALFVIVHALMAPLPSDSVVALTLVGAVASLLVLLTGRIWGAVLVHIVYNGIWVAMATVGTLLA
jgi:membrane protease YdiL (CAAX protease family)